MKALFLTPAARGDVEAIWDYTEERWGAEQAEKYLRQVQSSMNRVCENPQWGKQRDDVRENYFSVMSGSHVIFYKVEADRIVVVRILHQRMDPKTRM